MKIGILGTGDVGKALARAFLTLGHQVTMGSRDGAKDKTAPGAAPGTFAEAARFGELIVVATLGTATEDILRTVGAEPFTGKVVIDTTNPLDFSGGMPPKLFVGHSDSLGERIQRALPGAHVVKAFNIIGNRFMFRPEFPGGPPTMFICGNDRGAKQKVTALLDDFGFETEDIGGIESSRHLEPMCLVWVMRGVLKNDWNHAFKLLRE